MIDPDEDLTANTHKIKSFNVSADTNTKPESWLDYWENLKKEAKALEEKRTADDKLRLSLKRKDLFIRKKQQHRLG